MAHEGATVQGSAANLLVNLGLVRPVHRRLQSPSTVVRFEIHLCYECSRPVADVRMCLPI